MPPRSEMVLGERPGPLGRAARRGRFDSTTGFVLGMVLGACGLLALGSAGAGLSAGGDSVVLFLGLGVVWFSAGAALMWTCTADAEVKPTSAFVGAAVLWIAAIVVSTITYLVAGTFDQLGDALFESVAGFTTTASTVVPDPEALPRAVLTWRAGTQWLGGLAGLLFVVAVLPSIGVGGLDVTRAGSRHATRTLGTHRTIAFVRHLAGLYGLLTVAGVVLFLIGGMGPFDAVTYAATTISTGGFGNHAGSFAHFDSTTVEWAGVGGMVLGGANLALVFRAARGDVRLLLASFELRAYLTVVVGGGVLFSLLTMPDGGLTHETVRHAFFMVASATSTTGHTVGTGWSLWAVGPQVLLLAIIGVGAMSGSAGGGFRMVRALALIAYLRREIVLQVHPRAVRSLQVGGARVEDELADRMIGYQVQYLVLAGLGSVGVAAFGTDLVTASSAAVSALANMGPGLGDLLPGSGGVLQLPHASRLVLLPLMLLGRLEIAPVLVAASLAAEWLRRAARLAKTPEP